MGDELQTSGASADTGSTAEGALAALDTTPSVDTEPTGLATADQQTALAPVAGQAADFDSIVASIPADDADLEAQRGQQHYQALVDQRGHLRTLSKAVRELTPLKELAKLGSPTALRGKLELANKLYSPMIDPTTRQPRIDPATQTPYITTRPFIEHLDQNSPGMPEQLLADLLDYQTEVNGVPKKMSLQVLDYWDGKFPGWWKQRYGSQIAPITGAVTPEELAAFPSQYHEGIMLMPIGLRSSLSAYDDAEQVRILEDYKGKAETKAKEAADKTAATAKEATDAQRLQVYIQQEQSKYFDAVRRERFSAISQTLAKQLTFSEDAVTNSVMHGSVGTILWNLIDPDGRFIAEETILKPLGFKLDVSFNAALNRFNTNAANAVAYAISGDNIKAADCEAEAQDAADQLVAKLGIIGLEVARRMGAKQAAGAATLGKALDTANTVRPNITGGTSQPQGGASTILPTGMNPNSPEALQYIAEHTNFVRG